MALLLGASVPSARAQGSFANFETPQTHPIEIAHVAGQDYVLVCNTPDNSVEIYQAAPPHAFLQRIPVGMGPASVRWNPALGRFYTCNFDGDSVSVVSLHDTGLMTVAGVLERTTSLLVGDEPADIAFDPTNTLALVSLSSRSAVSFLHPQTLASMGPPTRLTAILNGPQLSFAVKMPRAMAWLPDGRFFAANFRGGSPNPSVPIQYDLGIYRIDPFQTSGQPDFTGGLGSTNHAFAVSSDGTLLFVVGTKAKNHAAVGVQAVSQLPTGFVESWLMVVDAAPNAPFRVHPEAPGGGASPPPLPSINLNRDYASPVLVPVASGDALVQPTDVLLLEDPAGAMERIVLSAFHSDRLALLTPSATALSGYTIQRIDIPLLASGSYSIVGPRGLAYSAQNGLLFTNGRLDNSLAVIDVGTSVVTARIPLQNDPTPVEIRQGRQFLYSNRFSIDDSQDPLRGGFVSCAACHVDGRTDGLPWDLGDVTPLGALQPGFHDPRPLGNGSDVPTSFPSEKGPMVTQTLQGLVNFQVNESFQFVATNAPYHWRGDKGDLVDFNEAFVNLQGMDNVGTPQDPKGISDADMIAFRRFVNTILHPPNPEQDLRRITPGEVAGDLHPKLGMDVFHNRVAFDSRSCVDCHSLPDGSSNTATLAFFVQGTIIGDIQSHPFESAALRNIAQREMVLHDDSTDTFVHFTANSGLLHPGDLSTFAMPFSINTFIHANFPGISTFEREAVVQFVRQLDTGTAPAAGFAYTVDPTLSPLDSGLNKSVFDLLEAQVAEANAGLGVYTRNLGAVKGYWFDVTLGTPAYREEGTANVVNRAGLLALAVSPSPGDNPLVIAQATPLGGERRWASPSGVATPTSGPPPIDLRLEAMAPNTAYVDVASFNGNLNLGAGAFSSIWALRTLQQSVLGLFGMPMAHRHEPPRRFRVTGDDIRVGAKLLIGFATANPGALPIEELEMELFPTTRVSDDGLRIWETRAELDAHQTFALLNGGYWAPDVTNVLLRHPLGITPNLQPGTWNQYLVSVVNEDATTGQSALWQALTIQDGR